MNRPCSNKEAHDRMQTMNYIILIYLNDTLKEKSQSSLKFYESDLIKALEVLNDLNHLEPSHEEVKELIVLVEKIQAYLKTIII